MAYNNFKATIWSKTIELELAPLMIFRDVVNTKYKGLVGKGKTVKILGLANPTIKDYVPGTDIDAPETPEDTSTELKIDQFKYFNVEVDDVDDAQADVDTMKALCKGGATGLAAKADAYIASLVVNCHEDNLVASQAVTTEKAAKAVVDKLFELLWNKGVNTANGNVYICVSPWFYTLFKNSLTELLTNNVDMVKKGILGMYNGAYVKMSNQIFNDGTDDYISVMTKDAIAFADGIEETEAYRPHKSFSDAVKSLYTYGAKVARPEQLATAKVHKG